MKKWIRLWSTSDQCFFIWSTDDDVRSWAEELEIELDGWADASPKEIQKLKGFEYEGLVQG